jgi:hypothetical protein
MAERTGLEPATLGVTGRYSNQLNYRSDVRRHLKGARNRSSDAGDKLSRSQAALKTGRES